jgi:flagellar secretion chaperone FliS
MNPLDAAQTYREAAIENAPPVKIVRLLYEGALRFLDRAIASDAKDPRSRYIHWLSRADAIVSELRMALDHEHGPEVAANLANLYLFCERRIMDAQTDRDPKGAEEARDVLRTLLEAWRSVELDVEKAG